MKLTVLICTHNRSDLLMQSIDSLNNAILPNNCTVSIIVVANACSDDTTNKLVNYQSNSSGKLPLYFSEEPRAGKSYALNHGIKMIEDGFIAFIDDDQRVNKKFLTSIQVAINKYPKTSIFCGQLIPDWTGLEPSWIHTQGQYKIYPEPVPHFELGPQDIEISNKTAHPSGGNLIIGKDIFTKVGTFSTQLGPKGHNLVGGEDSDFVLRALNRNVSIMYIPSILQYHYVDLARLKLSYLILNSFQRTRSFTLVNNPTRMPIPLYMWRKLFNYTIGILFSFDITKIRFYLMRFASTVGEIIGLTKKGIN